MTWRSQIPDNADGLDIALLIERFIPNEAKWGDALEWVKERHPALHPVAAEYLRGMYTRRLNARRAKRYVA